MEDIDVQDIHEGERIPTLEVIGIQYNQIYEEDIPTIKCPCGKEYSLNNLFKCLYCEVFFCKSCASIHFSEE